MRFQNVLLVPVAYYNSAYRPGDVPDLALGYLAEYLKSHQIAYDVFDLNLGYSFDDLVAKIKAVRPDLLGIAMKSYRYKDSYVLIQRIKAAFPDVKIAVGAAHISTERERVLKECPAIDFGIVKEGEDTLIELCQGAPLKDIKGLLYRDGGKIVFTGERQFRRDINALPWPRYEKFELQKYWYPGMCVLSSRGCPEKCTFCAVPVVSGNWWRFRSPESMMEEISHWHAKGYRRIEFLDDNFTFHQERILKLCDLIDQAKKGGQLKGLRFNVPQGVRADRVTKQLLQRMKDAGFDRMSYGVEVGNEKMLALVRKGESLETIERAIRDAIDVGFDVSLNMMVGFPFQTLQDVEDTFNLALKYPIRHANFNNLVPYLGTEDFRRIKENGLFVIQPEEYLNDVNPKAERVLVKTPHITPEQRRYIEEKIPRVQAEIRKRYHLRRLRRDYGFPGKVIGTLYAKSVIPKSLFNAVVKAKNN
ncbi:MAG: radical SAM protein [Candidatus Aenigmarchaeota archaeon]|nr:radical SAM protein [Candidatus Aenigmarchaeota archaeon]